MGIFTNPSLWILGPRDVAGANELVTAYSERRQSLGQGVIDSLVSGDNSSVCPKQAQDTAYWAAMQQWCEGNCVNFVDYTQESSFHDTGVVMFTLATFRVAAGLPVDGFRRCVAREIDGTPILNTNYGIMQVGDYRGTWNFEDLQKAFSVLIWTTWPTSREQPFSGKKTFTTRDGYAAFLAGWPAASWVSDTGASEYYASTGVGGDYYDAIGATRYRSKLLLQNIPNFGINCIMDVWIRGQNYDDPAWFLDIDGLGFENGYYMLWPGASAIDLSGLSTYTTVAIGDLETNPWLVAGYGNPGGTPWYPPYGKHVWGILPTAILKWSFTNI